MTPDSYNMPSPGRIRIDRLHHRLIVFGILLLAALLILGSCKKGEDGYPGFAFVEFTWIDTEPEYIEVENEFIPAIFYWNWFYRVDPGLYFIYYEGVHWRGGRGHPYAWELEYEVWENPGTKGKPFWQDGEDGPDAYFTIECSPFGPELYYEEFFPEKSAVSDQEYDIILDNGEEIVIERQHNQYNIRLRYKRVDPRGSGQ